MFKKIVISLICIATLDACSNKSSQEEQMLDSCKSNIVMEQLLNDNKSFDHKLFNESISSVSFESIEDGSVLCSATINLDSLLDKQKKILLPIKYKVKANDNQVSYVNNKDFATRQKWLNWAKQTNQQLVDYKVLKNGVLFVKQDNNVNQSLNYNGNQISDNLLNNDNIKIEQEFILDNSHVFLIGSYTGGTIDNTTANHYLLSISSTNQVQITPAFAYKDSIEQKNNSLLIKVYDPEQVYTGEIPIIEYKNGAFVNLNSASLTPSYDGLTAQSIIDIAIKDGCYDKQYKVFDLSNACDQALKYCKLFKQLKKPVHDSSYDILKETCQ